MTQENKGPNIQSEGPLKISYGPGGSVNASTDQAATINMKTIESVGIKDLAFVEKHAINHIVGSVSHRIHFFGAANCDLPSIARDN
jgi:hypothetical protein